MGRGVAIVRLNTEDFIINIVASYDEDDFTVEIRDSGKSFRTSEIKSVWYRKSVTVKTGYEDKRVASFVSCQLEIFY